MPYDIGRVNIELYSLNIEIEASLCSTEPVDEADLATHFMNAVHHAITQALADPHREQPTVN